MLKHIGTANFDTEVLETKNPVLVDFWATWCGPCQMLAPILEGMANRTDFDICKIDVDENPELAASFGIASIPTLMAFKNGNMVGKIVGLCGEKDIEKMLDL